MSAPRPAAALRPCHRCGAASFVCIAPVREHGRAGEPIAMAVAYVERRREASPFARAVSCVGPKMEARPYGTYEVLVCTGCGDTRWYADLPADVELPSATLGTCECGEQRSLRVSVAQTRGAGGEPSPLRVAHFATRRWGFTTQSSAGSFCTFVCRGCGRTTWIAEALEAVPRVPTPSLPCTRCQHTHAFVVDPVNEDGATLRVLYDRLHMKAVTVGTYALTICAGCGVTDWTARDFASLETSLALGVAVLEAGAGHEGPYR